MQYENQSLNDFFEKNPTYAGSSVIDRLIKRFTDRGISRIDSENIAYQKAIEYGWIDTDNTLSLKGIDATLGVGRNTNIAIQKNKSIQYLI